MNDHMVIILQDTQILQFQTKALKFKYVNMHNILFHILNDVQY